MERTEEASWLEDAARAAPDGENGASLERWLDGMDEARWRTLLGLLERMAAQTAPRFRDVVEPDDALGELVLMTTDRWLPRFREELRTGEARTPLWPFLKLRLAGHLSEMRRKRRRRSRLLRAEIGPWTEGEARASAVIARAAPDPQEALFARELARLAADDPKLRRVLELRYAGHSQEEIATELRVSRPTVSRRLRTIAALAATLMAALLFAWWATRGSDESPPVIHPDHPSLPPPSRPAAPDLPMAPADPIEDALHSHREGIERCVALEAGPRVVEFRVKMNPGGRLDEVLVPSSTHDELHACLRTELRNLAIPPSQAPRSATFRHDVADRIPDGAVECARTGDHACVIEALERQPEPGERVPMHSLTELDLLVDAYRAEGPPELLRTTLEELVAHFPDSAQAAQQALEQRASIRARAEQHARNRVARRLPGSDLTPEARACAAQGDNQCVIRLLNGSARSPAQFAMLIEAYRARGDSERAGENMQTLIDRFPESPQAGIYRQILARM